jgi:hypothetical protein
MHSQFTLWSIQHSIQLIKNIIELKWISINNAQSACRNGAGCWNIPGVLTASFRRSIATFHVKQHIRLQHKAFITHNFISIMYSDHCFTPIKHVEEIHKFTTFCAMLNVSDSPEPTVTDVSSYICTGKIINASDAKCHCALPNIAKC